MKNDTFCPLPWRHLSMEASGLEFKTCCVSDQLLGSSERPVSLLTTSPQEALLHPTMSRIRKNMVQGEKSPECGICYREEENGITSMRRHYRSVYKETVESARGAVPRLENLELRLGNLCNLKCLMCHPINSSAYDDYGILFNEPTVSELPRPDQLSNSVFETLKGDLQGLKVLTFRGGEPLINQGHFKILSLLIESNLAGNIQLHYTTNGTQLPSKLFDLWSRFQSVTVWVSVEGIGELNDFIRFPSKWETIEKNLQSLDDWSGLIPGLSWGIVSTIQAYSLTSLHELFPFMARYKFGCLIPFVNYLQEPRLFDLRNLPVKLLRHSHQKLSTALHSISFQKNFTNRERKLSLIKESHRRSLATKQRFENFLTYLMRLEGGLQHDRNRLIDLTYHISRTREVPLPMVLQKLLQEL